MISLIIPVYNVEKYLRQCLDSIIEQTYRDLEILVIEDGSTDASGRICDEYERDQRVRLFHTENRGLSAARNLGLEEAHGDYIEAVEAEAKENGLGALYLHAEASNKSAIRFYESCGYEKERIQLRKELTS